MKFSDKELEELFCEEIDDTFEQVELLVYKYSPSYALKQIDPIAFDCEFSAWLDAALKDEMLYEHSDGTYHSEKEQEE